jgi:diguanylate cyclase (GGDEF)-like protein
LTTLLGALRSGILFVDEQQRVIYANAMFSQIWALSSVAAGMPMTQILPALRQQVAIGSTALVDLLQTAVDPHVLTDGEITLSDGRLISQRMYHVDDSQHGAGGSIWLHQDITLDRQTQQRARLALVDPLTDLINRRGLFEELHLAIGRAEQAGSSVSLLFIDLDEFKHANDVAGHWAGDQILVMVARALSGLLHPDQQVARMGSDEFAVIAPGQDAEQVAALAARLVQSISALRFDLDEHRIRIGCSIGVAMYPRDAGGADQLVACADRAMHQAKIGGKNGYCLYQDDSAHSQAEFERVSWNGRIYGALRDQRLELHFQPVHRVSDLGIVYYEALVRMVDEDDASHLIGPTAFVPYAERSGKIRQIDRWVFQACLDKLAQSPTAVCIAANLSARSLDDPGFEGFLRDALERSGVDPRRLHIELTETAAMGDLVAARPMIAALRSVGCAVHLDDFGSGFSSFVHLKLLEVDGIKIDGSFIRDLTSDPSNQLVVASLIKIARSLNKTTVAECVEDAATLEALRELGVDHVQGFHLGRPARKLAERSTARDRLSVVTPLRRSAGSAGD